MKWLVACDYLPTNPMEGLIPPRVPKDRDRFLSPVELVKVWNACSAMTLWGPLIRLLILTAQRRSEVSGMAYSEVQGSLWTIPKERTKTGKAHLVHLAPMALQIINSRPEFIGRGVSGFSKAKARLDRLSGVDGWRLHDLRRTAATGMASLDIEPNIVERILNHYQGSVYQRFEYEIKRREALEIWERHLTTLGIYLE